MDLTYLAALPTTEFEQRRQRLCDQLPDSSAVLIFSAQEQTRNADSTYPFRQDSYFWYLTGFNEPNSALLLLKRGATYQSAVFLRPSDPLLETWNGRRLGVEKAPDSLKLDAAYSIEDINLELPKLLNDITALYQAEDQQAWGDKIVSDSLHYARQHQRQGFSAPTQRIDWRPLLDEMRLFKSQHEVALLQQAGQISALAHLRAMRQTRPNRYEYEIESEILHEFNRHGARFASYNSIVAGGENACILHYTENDQLLQDGDLVLIDAGCEFAMYAGDITRTFPVNGQFSPAQRAAYELVLKAEKRALELLVPGASIYQVNQEVLKIKVAGLVELGILHGEVEQLIADKAYLPFYMHGLGHWLGLDVHDVGHYGENRDRTLEVGMVLTVEPGLYLSKNSNIPEQYQGIGVRIEDNILITEYGNKVLTAAVPKEIDEIEILMQQK
ncbi:Xaa-Pro aminopeptidase [Testudinibacter sp. TR-2022]|uniref:Xaa-Pro aminopeptidase n=1 Tax=Testudinibacter sp. TR-2022 TaxID=2585029 RepID=UPI00111824CB|nr:Xaa-Pro aminopeptidase [Testudinibacter sp. TR-2022]TNH00780.1 Xaa-Pro aminopeptidase [Pasteurellaceae bacterium Phil31]TNH09597.1 Xaa-Pro aminopeptidase [Testudinibacter sp. TR-2022]TNH13069.1 Xaa-Pro aminopeptidase [Testudinibacter sp. TR-2022]TNH13197.1 Xaa-Pro aminopeptidase [Testudinibacter sp. TR-2022]TNH18440.1 Xaa-Pro aminopeptidase [Testudinibacter sp. TR-2022]